MLARRRRTNSGSDSQQQQQAVSSSYPYQQSHSSPRQQSPPPSQSPPQQHFIDPEMTCRDRSTEFISVVKSLQSRQGNGVVQNHRNKALHVRSEFTQIAKRIGKDLANTFAKLEKLTILAKRKAIFDDKPLEIQELTYIIKQDINSLNDQIAQLQQLAKSQKSQNGKHLQTHSNTVVVALQSKLASMSNDFRQVLEVRTENLKHQKSRREQFSSSPVTSSLPPSAFQGHINGSVLLQDDASHAGSGDVSIDMTGAGSGKQLQNQMQIIDEQDAYIQSRAETMQNIETTIVELGSIFQQLAHMVKEQEEIVGRIDQNIDEASTNIEAAHSEILKYFQSVTSNRWLMIKIFGVLMVFFIIFIVFMA
ncbi:syntaxin-5-like [Physella acuta]|uniref:syntaxin-5-like n=1 Tax=Physella acuta TaxID=109671 RepID=UPI0027DCCD24|nr:syntaxin-5-like [Physella acuta]XP_059179355.1 syntaxin-5-like [Physella acuta]